MIRDLVSAASAFGGGLFAILGIGAASQNTEITPLAALADLEFTIATTAALTPAYRAPDLAAADRVLIYTGLLLLAMVFYAWANHIPRVDREKA